MLNKILFIFVVLLFCNLLVLGQYTTPRGTYPASVYRGTASEQESRKIIYDARRDRTNADVMPRYGYGSFTISSKRAFKNVFKYIRPEAFEKSHKQFLKQKDTGIFRLFSKKECKPETDKEVRDFKRFMKKCPSMFIVGGASFYSFREEEYTRLMKSDIGISGDWLFSFGKLNQGLLVELGDLDLTSISSKTVGVDFLFEYVPARDLKLADQQRLKLEDGFVKGNHFYRGIVNLKENVSYGLRVVAYDNELPTVINTYAGAKEIDLLGGDKRKDIIVVFRVLEKAEDGSVVILWKKIQDIDAPKLDVTGS